MHHTLLQTAANTETSPPHTHRTATKLLLAVGTAVLCLSGVHFLSNNGVSPSLRNATDMKYRVSVGGGDGKLIGTIPVDYCNNVHTDEVGADQVLDFRGDDAGNARENMKTCASKGVGGIEREIEWIKEKGGYHWIVKGGEGDSHTHTRMVKCSFSDKKWNDKVSHTHREVCASRQVNGEEGKTIAPEVYDAWRCGVKRFVRTEYGPDGDEWNPDRRDIYELSTATCVETDFVAVGDRSKIELTHQASGLVADSINRQVVPNAYMRHSIGRSVSGGLVLTGMGDAQVCDTHTPVSGWMKSVAYTHSVGVWLESLKHWDDKLEDAKKREVADALRDDVHTFVETGIVPHSGMKEKWYVPENVSVNEHSHTDAMGVFQTWLDGAYKHNRQGIVDYDPDFFMTNLLLEKVLPAIGVSLFSLSEAQITITFPPTTGRFNRTARATVSGVWYVKGNGHTLGSLTEMDAMCHGASGWLVTSARTLAENIERNTNGHEYSVDTKMVEGNTVKTYTYKKYNW
eukprot:GDKI01018114.1.p1 GENE.GDKI01018114.1~~GDKI01018114.1.p1  ORF type:complete len:514 (+),score=156.81 GDKI01018114.1:77-1618(+)